MTTATARKPKITALAGWAGGKRTLASRIVAELGPHQAYWGLCCGSLAVEFEKEPATMEVCIDSHGDLTNLAWVLQDEETAAELYGRTSRMLMSRELFLESAKVIQNKKSPIILNANPSVDRAYHYFIVSWFGRGGVAGTSSYNAGFCMRYTKNGGHAGKRFTSAVESIPDWHERLRHITIVRDDIFNHIYRIEDATGVVIYIDPPYIEKGLKYLHDFTEADHDRLAKELARFQKTRVVVSYYDHPRLDALYPGWTKVHLEATKALVNQGMRDEKGSVKAPEVLLINGESYTSGGMFS